MEVNTQPTVYETLPGSSQLSAPIPAHKIPAPPPPAQAEKSSNLFSVATVLGVLRRRWFLTLCLASPVAVGAAILAWKFIPAPFTAIADVRVRNHVLKAGRGVGGPQHRELKQTQMQLIRDRRVIEAALLVKGIGQLSEVRNQEDEIDWLGKNLKVKDLKTEFFRISLTGTNPKDLAKLLNAVLESYFSVVVVKDRELLNDRVKIYEKLRADAHDSLQSTRDALKVIVDAAAPNEAQLNEKQRSLLEYRLGLLKQIDETDIKIFRLEMLIAHRKKHAAKNKKKTKQAPVDKSILDDNLAADLEYQKAKYQLEGAEKRLKFIESRLPAEHKSTVKAKKEVERLQKELDAVRERRLAAFRKRLSTGLADPDKRTDAQLQDELEFLKTTKEGLKAKLKNTDKADIQIGKNTIDLADRKAEIERKEQFVQSLQTKITLLKAEQKIRDQEPVIEIWRKADPPKTPNRNKKIMGTAAAGIGGFGLVLIAIAFFDIRTRRLNSVQQLIELGLPVLGTVPLIPRSASTRKKGKWAGKARYWHGVLTESVDSARTMLVRDAAGPMQVFMVGSAASGEGKTTLSCHLATSLARAGNHVLLIDGDLRRPFVHRTFDLNAGPGLAEIIRGEAKLDEVLQPSGVARLPVLAAGEIDAEALSLLAQGRLAECLEEWRKQFDYIVIDSSPVLPVADGLLIAQHVDGVLLAVRRDVSRVSKVVGACERFSMLGVPVLGFVAIGLDHDSYGYHPYYGYQPEKF